MRPAVMLVTERMLEMFQDSSDKKCRQIADRQGSSHGITSLIIEAAYFVCGPAVYLRLEAHASRKPRPVTAFVGGGWGMVLAVAVAFPTG